MSYLVYKVLWLHLWEISNTDLLIHVVLSLFKSRHTVGQLFNNGLLLYQLEYHLPAPCL